LSLPLQLVFPVAANASGSFSLCRWLASSSIITKLSIGSKLEDPLIHDPKFEGSNLAIDGTRSEKIAKNNLNIKQW
jgi:hypothetical protein